MNKPVFLIGIFLLTVALVAQPLPQYLYRGDHVEASMVRVTEEGDLILKRAYDKALFRVRMYKIVMPERPSDRKRVITYLRRVTQGQRMHVAVRDVQGNIAFGIVGPIRAEIFTNLVYEVVARGLADTTLKDDPILAKARREAQAKRLGIWAKRR